MLRHNYSQLAVVDDKEALHGAITWESIAQAQMAHQDASTVEQAKRAAPAAAYDELVLPRIDETSSRGFIFVRSRNGRTVAGVITAADLAIRFGEIAKPFTMIEECERRLYRRVKAQVPPDVIAAATNNRHKSADTLTLGAYVLVLTDEWGAIDGLLAMLHAVDPLP